MGLSALNGMHGMSGSIATASKSGAGANDIISVTDDGGRAVFHTGADHGLADDEMITLSGMTNYTNDLEAQVQGASGDVFQLAAEIGAFNGDDTGTWASTA